MRFTGSGFGFPAQAEVQGELRGDFPVVLHIGAHVVVETGERLDVFEAEAARAKQETGIAEALAGRAAGELVALRVGGAEAEASRGVEDLERIEAVESVLAAGFDVVAAPAVDDVVLQALCVAGLVVVGGATEIGERAVEAEVGEEQNVRGIAEVRRQAERGGVEAQSV